MNQKTAFQLTRFVSIILFANALIWASAAFPAFDAPGRFYLDFLAWPLGDGRPDWNATTMWLSAIGAGLVGALAVYYYFIVAPAVLEGDRKIIRATIIAAIVWFVIDSAGSISAGFAVNALFNFVTLVPLIGPLLFISYEANQVGTSQLQ